MNITGIMRTSAQILTGILLLPKYDNLILVLSSFLDEVILEFRYWKDKKIGNGASFVGTNSNIPTCEGCDLILREDYYTQLKKIFPNLSFYAKALL